MRVSAIAACCVLLSTSPVLAAHQLANGRITIDFSDGGPGHVADVVTSATWVDSSGKTTPNLVLNDPDGGCGDPQEFFGQSYGDAGNTTFWMVWPGATSTWTPISGTSGVSKVSVEQHPECGTLVGKTTTTYTLGAFAAGKSAMKIKRTFVFGPDGVNQADNLRAYVPRISILKYPTSVYPDTTGTVQSVIVRNCLPNCTVANWNGAWVADDDGKGNGIVLIRDKSSKAPAKIGLLWGALSNSNSTSILLMRPAGGWRGKLTETEWLCFYDPTSWPDDQRRAGKLPKGCTAK